MENSEISFGLRRITTEQFAVIESALDESKDSIEISTALRFGFNIEKRIITPLFTVNFNQDKNPFLLLEIGCHFEIFQEHWDEMYSTEQQEIKLSKGLAMHLVVLCTGTLRGVLHAKTENTPYNKYFLPTINVNELIKEDIIIKVNDSIDLK